MTNIIGSYPSLPNMQTSKVSKATAKTTEPKDVVAEFLAYQKLSPEEKIRDSILKKYGYDKDGYEKLSGEIKKKIEDQIQAELKQKAKNNLAEKGILVDMSA
jgi:hypothetical protein